MKKQNSTPTIYTGKSSLFSSLLFNHIHQDTTTLNEQQRNISDVKVQLHYNQKSQIVRPQIKDSYRTVKTYQQLKDFTDWTQSHKSVQAIFKINNCPIEKMLKFYEQGKSNKLIQKLTTMLNFLLNSLLTIPLDTNIIKHESNVENINKEIEQSPISRRISEDENDQKNQQVYSKTGSISQIKNSSFRTSKQEISQETYEDRKSPPTTQKKQYQQNSFKQVSQRNQLISKIYPPKNSFYDGSTIKSKLSSPTLIQDKCTQTHLSPILKNKQPQSIEFITRRKKNITPRRQYNIISNN